MKYRALTLLGALIAACGIQLDGGVVAQRDEGGASSSGGVNDASPSSADVVSDADPPADDAADAEVRPAACAATVLLTTTDFSDGTRWDMQGDASEQMDGVTKFIRLTEERGGETGSVWWKQNATTFTGFNAALEFTIVDAPTDVASADGLGLAWVSNGTSSVPPPGGANGNNLGVCGAGNASKTGYAVLVDTQGPDRGIRFVNVKDCSPIMDGAAVPKPVLGLLPAVVTDGKKHTLEVFYRSALGVVVALVDGKVAWKAPAPPALTGNVFFGASAATGGMSSLHRADKLTVSVCN